ncbi:protein trichome birefringence-like 31 [Salvia miltiorrhiza]|uniref:protein trichome birefringence-like 31 n=1 Tax=Salvia miltiorrhiza TaxID=226208 RepID=UPI0025AC3D49|nr:protein trichome birefringence-like 31 [Salvia miltiorrhiza]
MTTLQHRRIHLLFRLAVAAVLTLGAARVILDNLRNNYSILEWTISRRYSIRVPIEVSVDEEIEEGCDVFQGRWIWENATYPLYTEQSCPFLVKQTTCTRNGRLDSFYQNWRWQPHACDLPRFDGLKLMEMLRDKRLMFVGDSVQRSMFESMICLVDSALPRVVRRSLQRIPPRKVFRVEEFNASIEYYWAPFLVESISDHATNHTVMKRSVKLDSVAKHSKEWEGAHVLIFESYIWWMYKPTINATYGSLDDVQEYNVTTAYRSAMETWANWVDSRVNRETQKIFFATMSPTHLWSWEWKHGTEGNCFNETHPIEGPYWGTGSNLDIMGIVEDVLGRVKVNVTVLNITQLSEYRKDGHASIFGERKGKLLTKEQRSDPKNFADCIHWCLPGVPDTWNEILYALLLQDYRDQSII